MIKRLLYTPPAPVDTGVVPSPTIGHRGSAAGLRPHSTGRMDPRPWRPRDPCHLPLPLSLPGATCYSTSGRGKPGNRWEQQEAPRPCDWSVCSGGVATGAASRGGVAPPTAEGSPGLWDSQVRSQGALNTMGGGSEGPPNLPLGNGVKAVDSSFLWGLCVLINTQCRPKPVLAVQDTLG
jgi:hypothetical protein